MANVGERPMVNVGQFVMYQPKPDESVPDPSRLVSTNTALAAPGMVWEPALALVVAVDSDSAADLVVFYSMIRTPTAFGVFPSGITRVQRAFEGGEPGQFLPL